MGSLTRVVTAAILLTASLSGFAAGAVPCDHAAMPAESGEHHAPAGPEAPCSHDQPGLPAGQCALMPACAPGPALAAAPVPALSAGASSTAREVPEPPLHSYRPLLDVPPPRA